MNWDAIGATGEWISGLATIGTLFYLAYQIRQNTRTARSSAYQAASTAITTWSLEMSRDPALMENFFVGLSDPDALDRRTRAQVGMQIQALFRNYENIFYQWREGAIADEVWEGWSRQAQATFWTPGARRWWPTWRQHCNTDFRGFLENSSPPEGELAIPNAARQWLSGVDSSRLSGLVSKIWHARRPHRRANNVCRLTSHCSGRGNAVPISIVLGSRSPRRFAPRCQVVPRC